MWQSGIVAESAAHGERDPAAGPLAAMPLDKAD
jgi:hypothetical protein